MRRFIATASLAWLGATVVAPACAGVIVVGDLQGLAPFLPVTGAMAILVSLGLLVRGRALAADGREAGACAAALSTVATIAVLAAKALDGRFERRPLLLGAPTLESDFANVEWGIDAVIAVVLLGSLAAMFGRKLAPSAARVHAAARVVVTLGVLVVGTSAWRTRWWPDPDAAGYLTGVPVVATLPPIGADPAVSGDPARRIHAETFVGLDVTRYCEEKVEREGYRCTFHITQNSVTFELRPEETLSYRNHQPNPWPPKAPADASMIVRREPTHDLWLVDVNGHAIAAGNAASATAVVRVRDLARALAPPIGWTVAASLTLVLAATALLRAAAAERRLKLLAAGRPGTLNPDGWVELDGGGSFQAATIGILPPSGRVVALFQPRGDATYREVPARVLEMVAGEHHEHLRRLEAEVWAHAGTALVAGILGGTPLGVAGAAGMLI